MYRTCDLVSVTDASKQIRRNVQEQNAQIGNVIAFRDEGGSWEIKRTHGYSIFAD